MAPPDLNLYLPYITADVPGIGGVLRAKPEDFVVEEIPLYQPSGTGNHRYYGVRRKNCSTRDLAKWIEQAGKLKPGSVGYAGLKDKNADVYQVFSVQFNKPQDLAPLERAFHYAFEDEIWGATHLGDHTNKLKIGHLLGNRFEIRITGIRERETVVAERMQAIATVLRQRGIPNYLGAQRFGMHGDNALKGYELLTGQRRERDKWLRQLLVTAYQSHLCNLYLARRVERDLFDQILPGDIAKKHDTGGIFTVENVEWEQPRFKGQEISFTAPLFGYKMTRAEGQPGAMERAIEQEGGITDAQWRAAHSEGTRRMGRILLHDLEYTLEYTEEQRAVAMRFSLPKGAFATTVLREFMKSEGAESPSQEMDDETE